MPDEIRIPLTRIHIGRFLLLLISLVSMLLFRPLLEGFISIRVLMDIFFSFILVSGVYAVSQKKRVLFIGVIVFLPTLILQWTDYFVPTSSVFILTKLMGLIFLIYVAVIILNYLFREQHVTIEVILGAVCVYFLIGMAWAFGYLLIEKGSPGAFQYAGDPNISFIYYSYVTLSTLGYGDITPVSSAARSLSLMEAITGQLYIAVLIARLVGIHISQSMVNRTPK